MRLGVLMWKDCLLLMLGNRRGYWGWIIGMDIKGERAAREGLGSFCTGLESWRYWRFFFLLHIRFLFSVGIVIWETMPSLQLPLRYRGGRYRECSLGRITWCRFSSLRRTTKQNVGTISLFHNVDWAQQSTPMVNVGEEGWCGQNMGCWGWWNSCSLLYVCFSLSLVPQTQQVFAERHDPSTDENQQQQRPQHNTEPLTTSMITSTSTHSGYALSNSTLHTRWHQKENTIKKTTKESSISASGDPVHAIATTSSQPTAPSKQRPKN